MIEAKGRSSYHWQSGRYCDYRDQDSLLNHCPYLLTKQEKKKQKLGLSPRSNSSNQDSSSANATDNKTSFLDEIAEGSKSVYIQSLKDKRGKGKRRTLGGERETEAPRGEIPFRTEDGEGRGRRSRHNRCSGQGFHLTGPGVDSSSDVLRFRLQ